MYVWLKIHLLLTKFIVISYSVKTLELSFIFFAAVLHLQFFVYSIDPSLKSFLQR